MLSEALLQGCFVELREANKKKKFFCCLIFFEIISTMTTCPVVMLSNLALDSSSPPSSPRTRTRLHRIGSGYIKPTNISLHKLSNIAAHATPASPSAMSSIRFTMSASSPPPSPGCRKIAPTMGLTITTTTPPTPTSSVPTNTRLQPVARRLTPATKSGKRKLGPGCGLLDWIRLCRSKTDLAGNGGTPRPVSLEELAEHDMEDDAWTAIRGESDPIVAHFSINAIANMQFCVSSATKIKFFLSFFKLGKVYNLTYYMKFHPGGRSELLRGAGIDCTILFDEVSKLKQKWKLSCKWLLVTRCEGCVG